MHKKVYFVIFSLFASITSPCATYAKEAQEIFNEANKFYAQGKFEEALELYQQLPQTAVVSYNLGNTFYKLGQPSHALIHYRKAERKAGFFGKKELSDNIRLVKQQLGSSENESYLLAARELIETISFWPLQAIFLLLWTLLFLFGRVLYNRRRYLLLGALFGFTVIFGTLLIVKYYLKEQRVGIVVLKEAQLRSGPKESFALLATLKEGTELVIEKEFETYFKVKFKEQIGWIDKKSIGIV